MASLSGVEKIAVLLAVLGREASARIMATFGEDEQLRVGKAMIELEEGQLDNEAVVKVVEEFHGMLKSGAVLPSRMAPTLQAMLEQVHGRDQAQDRVRQIREAAKSRRAFDALRGVKAHDLARVLKDEHPQVQALVLASIDSDQAAKVLENLEPDSRSALVLRMATMEEPSPRILKQVARQLTARTRELPRLSGPRGSPVDPRLRTVADILNASTAGADKEILGKIEEEREEMAAGIRECMFSWNDLAAVDVKTMQKILAGVDTKMLALALKACDQEITDAVLGATSQRTKDMIMEERELLGAVPLADAIGAQNQILQSVRQMMESGELRVSRGSASAMVT